MTSRPPEGPEASGPLEFVELRDAPRLAAWVARRQLQEWYSWRGACFREVYRQVRRRPAGQGLPSTTVALQDGLEVGAFTLESMADPFTHQPIVCLSNLFIVPERRGQGLGRRLCAQAIAQARRWQIPQLSLFTSTHAAWYAAMGWNYVNVQTMISRGRQEAAIQMSLPIEAALLSDERKSGGLRDCGAAKYAVA